MKYRLLTYITPSVLLIAAIAGCDKGVEPITAYGVTVEYKNSNEFAITADKTVNPKDSIYFDFNISSSKEEMTYVEIQKNGVRIDTFNVTGNKTIFSGSKGYRIDSIPGDYSYRILARNRNATFLGDGGKTFKITVKPDFDFWSYRILQVPDSTAKTNKCYYSTKDGKIFSFTDGAANAAGIDFGYYFDTSFMSTTSTTDDLGHTIYALTATQGQLNYYDISSWTKNATVFKKLPSSVNFVSQLTSAGAIQTLVGGNLTSGTAAFVNKISTAAGNNVIGFKRADGKLGAILVRFIQGNSPSKTTQIEIDVKVQK